MHAHAREGFERVVRQDVDSLRLASATATTFLVLQTRTRWLVFKLSICFRKNQRPQVFAQELDHVQRVCEARPIARESVMHHPFARQPIIAQ